MEIPMLLRHSLDLVGRPYVQMYFKVVESSHPDYPTTWRASSRLYLENHSPWSRTYISKHYSIARQETEEAAISDAARQVLSYIHYVFCNTLCQTKRRYYPRRESRAVGYTIEPVNKEER